MEIVPTGDGDEDDGVIWFRCPQCQGFLPKLSGADLTPEAEGSVPAEAHPAEAGAPDAALPWDSPADMMAALAARDQAAAGMGDGDDDDPLLGVPPVGDDLPALEDLAGLEDDADGLEAEDEADAHESPATGAKGPVAEPILEYAALLAEVDPAQATPYRHFGTYEVGQCIHHLAWNDCGVVVAKEKLPGGRQVIKVYFEEAGVVRLIEQAPR